MSRIVPFATAAGEGPDRRALMACIGGAGVGLVLGPPRRSEACAPLVGAAGFAAAPLLAVIAIAALAIMFGAPLIRLGFQRAWEEFGRAADR